MSGVDKLIAIRLSLAVYNGYDEGASCDAKSPFLLLHSEELGDGRTRYFHCIDGSMKAVICPSDKPALQDICNGYNKHCKYDFISKL